MSKVVAGWDPDWRPAPPRSATRELGRGMAMLAVLAVVLVVVMAAVMVAIAGLLAFGGLGGL